LDLSVYNKMTREIHKKEVAKKDKVWKNTEELSMVSVHFKWLNYLMM
jgi:hypothetical protein